jgi:PAS domain S-box-containing protein
MSSLLRQLGSGIDIKMLVVSIVIGSLIFVAIIFGFNLTVLITQGESGKEAMEVLHKMRYPFFKIHDFETQLLEGRDGYADIEGLNNAINNAYSFFAVYLDKSKYNQQLYSRIRQQKITFDEWVNTEHHLFAIFPEMASGNFDNVSYNDFLATLSKTSTEFLKVLKDLEEAEHLIEKDITRGYQAYRVLLILLCIYILYLISLIFLYRESSSQQLTPLTKSQAITTPLVVISILLLSIIAFFYSASKKQINDEFESTVHLVNGYFSNLLDEETTQLSSLLSLIASNSDVQKVWVAGDREKLYKESLQIFRYLYREQNITHFYYHQKDGINYLRVHKPDKYGDQIERHTMRNAMAGNQLSSGLELGPLGTFTLRVVQPWFFEDELSGYMELGIDIDYIIMKLANSSGMKFIVVLDKSDIDQDSWDSWKKDQFLETDWDLFKDVIVAGETYPGLSETLKAYLNKATSSQEVLKAVLMGAKLNKNVLVDNVSIGNQPHRSGYIQLQDVAGQHVGYLFFFQDVSSEIATIKRTIMLIVVLGITLIFIIIKREQDEEKLRLAASTFDTQEGIFITDNDGNILRVNQAFSRITGYNEEEIIGKNSNILKSGRHDTEFYQEMWSSLSEKGYWKGEIWNRNKNGEIYLVWLSITSVKDENGITTHHVGHFVDITSLKEREKYHNET